LCYLCFFYSKVYSIQYYFVFQALFSNILVMPVEGIALALQFDVDQYGRDSLSFLKTRHIRSGPQKSRE
jgi:hypothetical protein